MPRKQQMSLDTPQPAGTLAEQLAQIETLGDSPLMRVVAREFEAIEQARARGLTYHQIARALAPQCRSANPKTLRECVYRIRKRQRSTHPTADTAGKGDTGASASSGVDPSVVDAIPRRVPQTPVTGVSEPLGSSSQSHALHGNDGTNLKTATESAARSDPGFIGDILRSTPDLDALARRYRATQRSANSPASTQTPRACGASPPRPTPVHPVPEDPTGDREP